MLPLAFSFALADTVRTVCTEMSLGVADTACHRLAGASIDRVRLGRAATG